MELQVALTDRRTSITIKIAELAAVRKEEAGFAFIDHSKSGPRAVIRRVTNTVANDIMAKYTTPTLFNDSTETILQQGIKAACLQPEGPKAAKKAKHDTTETGWETSSNWWQTSTSSSSGTWQWQEKKHW